MALDDGLRFNVALAEGLRVNVDDALCVNVWDWCVDICAATTASPSKENDSSATGSSASALTRNHSCGSGPINEATEACGARLGEAALALKAEAADGVTAAAGADPDQETKLSKKR